MPTLDPTEVAQPMAPEQNAGGSFIPQAPQSASPPQAGFINKAMAARMAKDSHGRAREVNDFGLTVRGIADGDPVGMETFDLGFFEDGTPAIVINGANVPIRHEQWMSLLTQRNKMRSELKQRAQFETEKQMAVSGINRILAAAPSVPPHLGELLLMLAQVDPAAAMQEMSQLLVSMSRDNGRTQISKLGAILQDSAVNADKHRLSREIEIPEMDDQGYETGRTRKSTASAEKYRELMSAGNDPRKRKTAFAIGYLEALFPPNGLKADPAVAGGNVGFFDMVAREGGDTGDLSKFDMLKHLAAFSGLWGDAKVDWQDPPTTLGGFSGPRTIGGVDWMMAPDDWKRYRKYIGDLDNWASKALHWDRSDPKVIDLTMSAMMQGIPSSQAELAQQVQQATNQGRATNPSEPPNPFDE